MVTVTNYMAIPDFRVAITHGGTTTNYDNDLFTNINVRRVENGVDQALLTFADTESAYYDDHITSGDTVVVQVDNAAATLLSGKAYLARPTLTDQGEVTVLQVDGSGYGLSQMLVADEYGTQSNNPTLDTIKEIVENAAEGIKDEYVNDILNSGVTSGFTYLSAVETIAGTIPYIEFPYKPADKCLNDLCDLVTALKAGAAGPHWIVTNDNHICIATVGNHGAPAATKWPTWLNSTTDNTLEQGVDFTTFNFETLDKAANYVLYHGKFMRPVHDVWTESAAAAWGGPALGEVISDDAGNYVVGDNSVELHNNNVIAQSTMWYPSARTLGLDLTVCGGEKNPAELCFYGRVEYANALTSLYVRCWTSAGNYYEHDIASAIDLGGGAAAGSVNFVHFRLPLGPYFPADKYPGFTAWTPVLAGDWTNINAFEFEQNGVAMSLNKFYIDDLRIEGTVLRAARQAAAYSATDPCKMTVVTDNIGKDDTLKSGTPGTTDQGTVALMAKAEWYRMSSTPTVGYVTTPMIKGALPGQLVHIHAKKKRDGTFTVDANMRILKAIHNLGEQGATTTFELTSDVLNGRARSRFGDINQVLRQARPEFQDRQASSIKMPDLDVTQAILTESY